MSAISLGQYLPGDSLLHRTDARAKLISLLLLIAAVILTDTWIGYGVMLLAVAGIVLLSKTPLKTALSPIRRLWLFFIIIFLMNALFFTSENPLWHWWIFTLSTDGLVQGANVVFRLLLIILLSGVLTATTPPMELTGAIEFLMSPLKLLRIPVEEVAMILSVAIQFIPTLLQETDTIKKAQTARGARFESKRLTERAAAVLPMLIPIFLSAFKRADELSMAMEARGYRSAKHRTAREKRCVAPRDIFALLVCAALCAAEIFI